MDLTSFSHGQIKSKLWLCDEIKPFLPKNATVFILGSWYNVLGLLLFTKFPEIWSITGIDNDPSAISIAEKINSYWYIEGKMNNICMDANVYSIPDGIDSVVINCSPEHFETNDWLNKLSSNCLVCIQSSNVTSPDDPWFIKQPVPTYNDFLNKYKLNNVLFSGVQKIEYPHFAYERYMIIGNK